MALIRPSRRGFLRTGSAFAASFALPSLSRAASRPVFTHGVQSGDVDTGSGMIWTRTDRPARVEIEVSTTESFRETRRFAALDATPQSDFAVKRMLTDLPPDQDIFYRFTATDLFDPNAVSAPVTGRFRTAPDTPRNIRFAWAGDTAGQGWGIDERGMLTYASIARHRPDFFLHSGDTVYADGPMTDEVTRGGAVVWRNTVLIDAKRKVAESLPEFRDQWKYNMMDTHVRAMNAQVPSFMQWDDHEVVNNWSPSKSLRDDDRYSEKNVQVLTRRAARAFHEMTPLRSRADAPGRVYRKIAYGPLLDVFFLDLRSYRGPNQVRPRTSPADATRLLGAEQMAWLKRELQASRAVWKVIASDQPLGVIVWDSFRDQSGAEAVADGVNGPPMGREVEIADLLRFIHRADISNTVWFTADVHYTAAHYYDPSRAKISDFKPFWEFVSGPLHAATGAPGPLDATFGPQRVFAKGRPNGTGPNPPPSDATQFFGLVDIDGDTRQMRVRLMDRGNSELYAITLDPER